MLDFTGANIGLVFIARSTKYQSDLQQVIQHQPVETQNFASQAVRHYHLANPETQNFASLQVLKWLTH